MRFVLFPAKDEPCLIAIVVGTQGLAPDEAIKMQAIARWLNARFGTGQLVAWATQDPTRTAIDVPESIRRSWSAYETVFKRYGRYFYAIYKPTVNQNGTVAVLASMLDVMFEDRGHAPLKSFEEDAIRNLKGAIRFAVEKQLRSLETQSGQGAFVYRLITFAESLLLRLRVVPARRPAVGEFHSQLRRPWRTSEFIERLQAIEWTVEGRGLAGLSDLDGVPWRMPMEQFFEAWVETVMRQVVRRTAGCLTAGRRREAVSPLS